MPSGIRDCSLVLRSLIFKTAAATPGVGELQETLKWGEPAYLTATSKSGSTLRLGWKKTTPQQYAIYFNCQTDLVDTFRALFPRDFEFEGEAKDLASAQMYSLYEKREFPWSATVAGAVSGRGRFPTLESAKADLTITRAEGAAPVEGKVTFDYDVAARRLTLWMVFIWLRLR